MENSRNLTSAHHTQAKSITLALYRIVITEPHKKDPPHLAFNDLDGQRRFRDVVAEILEEEFGELKDHPAHVHVASIIERFEDNDPLAMQFYLEAGRYGEAGRIFQRKALHLPARDFSRDDALSRPYMVTLYLPDELPDGIICFERIAGAGVSTLVADKLKLSLKERLSYNGEEVTVSIRRMIPGEVLHEAKKPSEGKIKGIRLACTKNVASTTQKVAKDARPVDVPMKYFINIPARTLMKRDLADLWHDIQLHPDHIYSVVDVDPERVTETTMDVQIEGEKYTITIEGKDLSHYFNINKGLVFDSLTGLPESNSLRTNIQRIMSLAKRKVYGPLYDFEP
jgi:hypothetical protein